MEAHEIDQNIYFILDNDCADLSREDYRSILEEVLSDVQSRLDALDDENKD